MFYARKYDLEVLEVGSKQSVEAMTDYPLTEEEFKIMDEHDNACRTLPEEEWPEDPKLKFKNIKVISYDQDKYCLVLYKGEIHHIKCGYCYSLPLTGEKSKYLPEWTFYKVINPADLPYLARKEPSDVENLKIAFKDVFK